MKAKTLAEVLKRYSDNISSIEKGKRGVHLANQEAAIHIATHGDYTVATKGVRMLEESDYGLSADAKATVDWFVKYCGLEIGENDEGVMEFTGWKGAQFIRDNFAEAKANPYYKGIKKSNPFEFDLHEALMGVYNKANQAAKKAANDETAKVVIDPEELVKFKALLNIPVEQAA